MTADDSNPESSKRYVILRKACPACTGQARAEARLPISAGLRPAEIDLDQLSKLGEQLSLGQLLALVEVIPYKLFQCPKCGHSFKLASQTAKDLVMAMLGSMQPVAHIPPKVPRTKAAEPPKASEKSPSPAPAPAGSGDDEWEPEDLDPN